MNELFEHFQTIDIQAMRKETAELKQENEYLKKENQGAEEKGRLIHLIELVCKKIQKGKSVDVIADELEEDESLIQSIVAQANKYAPHYDAERIWEDLKNTIAESA